MSCRGLKLTQVSPVPPGSALSLFLCDPALVAVPADPSISSPTPSQAMSGTDMSCCWLRSHISCALPLPGHRVLVPVHSAMVPSGACPLLLSHLGFVTQHSFL